MRTESQLAKREKVFVNILNYCLVIFLCIFFIGIPQINLNGYVDSTLTSKFICFSYGCLVILLLFISRLLVSQSIRLSITKLDLGLFVLLLYITLNRYVFQSVYGFSLRYVELLGLSFLYVVLRVLPSKSFYWLLLSIVFSGIIQAVYGNLQLLGYYPSNHSGFKMTGSFFNPGPFAGFLVLVWCIALGMCLFKDKVANDVHSQFENRPLLLKRLINCSFEYIPLFGVVSVLLVIPASQSRASWLAIIVGSIILLEHRNAFFSKVCKRMGVLKKVLLTVFGLIVLGIGLFGVFQFKKASANGRLFVWKVTTEMIADVPFFGVGFDRFRAHYMDYQADYFKMYREEEEVNLADNVSFAFNEFIQFLSDNGFIGFSMLIIILFIIFGEPLNTNFGYLAVILKACMLSMCVFACFSYPMYILPIKLVLIATLAMLSGLCLKKYGVVSLSVVTITRFFNGLVVLTGLVICYKYFAYIQKLDRGFVKWHDASELYGYGLYQGAIEEYKLAYPVFKRNGDFLMNYGKALSITGEDAEALVVLNQAKQHLNNTVIETALGDAYKGLSKYNKAEHVYKHAANMVPSRFYPQYLLAKLYEESGQEEKARIVAKYILKKNVKIPSIAINEIREEMKKLLSNN